MSGDKGTNDVAAKREMLARLRDKLEDKLEDIADPEEYNNIFQRIDNNFAIVNYMPIEELQKALDIADGTTKFKNQREAVEAIRTFVETSFKAQRYGEITTKITRNALEKANLLDSIDGPGELKIVAALNPTFTKIFDKLSVDINDKAIQGTQAEQEITAKLSSELNGSTTLGSKVRGFVGVQEDKISSDTLKDIGINIAAEYDIASIPEAKAPDTGGLGAGLTGLVSSFAQNQRYMQDLDNQPASVKPPTQVKPLHEEDPLLKALIDLQNQQAAAAELQTQQADQPDTSPPVLPQSLKSPSIGREEDSPLMKMLAAVALQNQQASQPDTSPPPLPLTPNPQDSDLLPTQYRDKDGKVVTLHGGLEGKKLDKEKQTQKASTLIESAIQKSGIKDNATSKVKTSLADAFAGLDLTKLSEDKIKALAEYTSEKLNNHVTLASHFRKEKKISSADLDIIAKKIQKKYEELTKSTKLEISDTTDFQHVQSGLQPHEPPSLQDNPTSIAEGAKRAPPPLPVKPERLLSDLQAGPQPHESQSLKENLGNSSELWSMAAQDPHSNHVDILSSQQNTNGTKDKSSVIPQSQVLPVKPARGRLRNPNTHQSVVTTIPQNQKTAVRVEKSNDTIHDEIGQLIAELEKGYRELQGVKGTNAQTEQKKPPIPPKPMHLQKKSAATEKDDTAVQANDVVTPEQQKLPAKQEINVPIIKLGGVAAKTEMFEQIGAGKIKNIMKENAKEPKDTPTTSTVKKLDKSIINRFEPSVSRS